ncbi:zinc finger protein 626 [Aedes aegypti]|uniref:Uncharacterized protein n=1 Tax=Aedes aegypti TaxID=7159 RepID=A0A1S4FFW1_AEDAE|nr:zinc finger protein 626 [Aedes aegypti]
MDPGPQLCRLCLIPVDPDTVVILNQAVDLIDSILQLTTVDVIVDSLRRVFMCDQCQNTLDVCIQFRMMCLQNDASFRKMCAKQALSLDDMRNECDSWTAAFVPCKVEEASQHNDILDKMEPEISLEDNGSQDGDDQHSLFDDMEVEKQSEMCITETIPENDDQQLPAKKPKVKKVRKKRDHQDQETGNKSSSKDRKRRKTAIKVKKPYKPPANRRYVKVQCQICGGFYNREHLAQHQTIHSDDRPMFACDLCPKKYPYKKNLKEHVKIVHENTADYTCTECGKTFNRRGPLQSHYIAIHTDLKKYECKVCGEKFARSGTRNYHFKMHHTNLRPYSCQYCQMTFKRCNDLTLHHRTHTGEKPYKCDLCDKRFAKSYNVVIHKKSHRNAELRRAAQIKADNSEQSLNVDETGVLE